MKYIILLITSQIFLFSQNCFSKKNKMTEYTLHNQLEKIPEIYTKEGINIFKLENDSTLTIESLTQSYGYITKAYYSASPFVLVKKYYHNKNIMEKGFIINSGSYKKGIWYYFDSLGNLSNQIIEDKSAKFSIEQLLIFLKNKSIPITNGFIENGIHTKIYFDINIKPTYWVVEYLFTTNKLKKITIDAQTGKIINTELINYIFN